MRKRSVSWTALTAAVLALGTDVVYLAIIAAEEGPNEVAGVALVAGTIALAGAAALAASLSGSRERRFVLLSASATALFVWGVLGAFSIGALLLVAAVFAVVALAGVGSVSRPASVTAAVAALVVIAVTIVGLVVTA